MAFIVCIFIIVVILRVAGFQVTTSGRIVQTNNHLVKEDQVRKQLRQRFVMDELFVSWHDFSTVGFSFKYQKVILGRGVEAKRYSLSQITSVEIIQNGASLTKTNRGSQLAGAGVGFALLGPMGALLGGLSGSSTTTTNVSELSLKFIVDDRVTPVYVVNFFYDGTQGGSPANSSSVTQAREQMERMHAHMVNMMRTGERVTQSELSDGASTSALCICCEQPHTGPGKCCPACALPAKARAFTYLG